MPDRPSLFDSPDLSYRMSMLPGATYRNPDGSERLEWALPSMITEPIDALYRLGQNSVLPDGRPGIPNPQNVENQNDVLTGLFSLYGGNAMNPGRLLEGAAAKAEVAPQRMYHGTGAADDFTTFRPSESGAFGPGVYLSNDASHAGSYAGLEDGARVMPLDVSGPFASMDDYLTTLHANGRNPEAAQNALVQQGYTGVTGDIGGSDFSNVTNVFKPGSVRSATTGETLFSDTGKPSLFGSAVAGAGRSEGPSFAAPAVNIYDPPYMPKRAFEEDYPYGAPADPQGRLTHDIDGNHLNQNARYIVGRRMAEGEDQALPATEFDALAKAITGSRAQAVSPREMGQDAGRTVVSKLDGRPLGIELRNDLSTEDLPRVYGHELGHVIDRTTVPFSGIPMSDATNANRASLLSQELGQVYHDLNNPDASLRGMALPEYQQFSPASLNYAPEKWNAEFLSEALRAYMADPNYMKTVAPTVAQRIREHVNPNPELNGLIQFNSDNLPSLFGSALAPYQQEPRNALLGGLFAQNDQEPSDYLKKHMDQPYQQAPGEDFQYTPITPEISSKLSTFAAPLIEKMMKANPGMDRYKAGDKVRSSQEYLQYKRTLVKPQPFNPPPSP